jgi:cytochrome c oxidase subunit 2
MHMRPSGAKKAALVSAGFGLVLLLTGCQSKNISSLGFDKGVSSVNDITLPLWQGAWIAAGVVGVLTALAIFYPILFNRKRNDELPRQFRHNNKVEISLTAIAFIIVLVLFGFTARAESKITHVDSAAAAQHNIEVKGIQWSWQFTYNDAGTGPSTTVTGTPAQPPTLVLPLGEKVRFTLTSHDVDHGFWIPAFMIQMQNLPGVENHLEFAAQKLGSFPGRCNILCGRNHSQMLFTVKVVTPAEYQIYLSTLKAA